MKKSLLFAAVAAMSVLALASCQKKGLETPVVEEDQTAYVSFCLQDADVDIITKASDATKENIIKSVQLYVFRKGGAQDGLIDNSVYVALNSPVSGSYTLDPLKCTVGDREAWVVVNAPKDYTSEIKTLADLKKKTVTLADNADAQGQKLLMVGNVMTDANGQVVTKLTSGNFSVNMKVERLVAGIRLAGVINKMMVPALQGSVSITGAYLMNVPGLQALDGSLLADTPAQVPDANWYAKNKKAADSEPLVLLVEKPASAASVPYGDTGIAPNYLLYSLPSNIGGKLGTQTETDRVESDGNNFRTSTYLVVEAKLGTGDSAIDCVYPILLPQLEANRKYNVTLTINHIGGDPAKPWEKIKFSDFSAGVTVGPWTDVNYSEAI